MDTLVARYSRPTYGQSEALNDQDEMDFNEAVSAPSLKFAMPPVAQVRAMSRHALAFHNANEPSC